MKPNNFIKYSKRVLEHCKQKKSRCRLAKEQETACTQEERDLSAQDSIHSKTLGSVRIVNPFVRQEMSRTPSRTMRYLLLAGQLARNFYCAGEARATYRKPLRVLFRMFTAFTHENTRTPVSYRSTNDSIMKSEQSSLVRGSDLRKCHSAHTSVGDMWRGQASRLIKKHFIAG